MKAQPAVETLVSRTFPERRKDDVIDPTKPERRRTFKTMDDKLAAEAKKQEGRRFTGDPLTDFGDSLK